MVRIYCDKVNGEYLVQTTCLDPGQFISELAEALAATPTTDDDRALVTLAVLEHAFPIAYKLSGYKAEEVMESRTLVCGKPSLASCQVLATAGR